MKYFLLLMMVFGSAKSFSQKHGFIRSLKDYQGNDTLFKTKGGHLIEVSFVVDSEEHVEMAPVNCSVNTFSGTDRRKCKTSIAAAPLKSMDFNTFIAGLTPDATMMANTAITKDPNNPRVAQENHNYQLTGILLFAIKRESDNDYHMIIGDKNHTFFNVEISGLPATSAASFQKLSKARATVDAFFGQPNCNTGGYTTFAKGVKIQLSGSTFYDIDHAPGTVGPIGFKPTTSWEIHPVTDIKFL